AAVEARVAMAGPVAGSLAAWATLWAGIELEQPLLRALGHTAVLINLFNLVPVPPLDGGRIVTAFTRTYWVIGYAVGIVALLVTHPGVCGAHADRALHALARRELAGRAAAAERRGAGLVLGRGRSRPGSSLEPPLHARARHLGRGPVAALVRGRSDELRRQLRGPARRQRARRAA